MDHSGLDVPEEGRQRLLRELEHRQVVVQDRVLDTLTHQLKEGLEVILDRQVLPIDFPRHDVSAMGVEVVELLLHLLYRCLSGAPALAEEACGDLVTKELD